MSEFSILAELFHIGDSIINGDKYKKEKEERKKEQLAIFNKKYGLSCRKCGKLAEPIIGTSNRYRCSCGNQFSAAKHPYQPED